MKAFSVYLYVHKFIKKLECVQTKNGNSDTWGENGITRGKLKVTFIVSALSKFHKNGFIFLLQLLKKKKGGGTCS